MPLTTYYANQLLDALRGTTHYLALFSSMPTDAGGGTELTSVTAPGYARVALSTSNLAAASSKQLVSSGAISFATGTGDGPTIVAVAIYDASTGGNMKWYDAVSEPLQWRDDDVLTIASGMLVINLV